MKKIKFSELNRRHFTLIGLVFVIAIAGYININYNKNASVETLAVVNENKTNDDKNTEKTADVKKDNYTEAIMNRDSKRSKSMDVYRNIINNSECDKETKDNAQKMLTLSAKYINDENTIETLIKAKGIEKSVVYIDENEVSVIVFDHKLSDINASQIKDIITEKLDMPASKIKIIENN